MSEGPQQERNWARRARALRDRKTRLEDGVTYVEGIRQVIAAAEGGHGFEAILVDPTRLRSEVAWDFISRQQAVDVPVAQLKPADFERISSRDNPVGLAAIVKWQPADLRTAEPRPDGLYLAIDDVRDPGNLGTLIRTADSLGADGVIIHAGTDPGHPTAVRASLGTLFRLPIYSAPTLNELFYWTSSNGIAVVGTTAKGSQALWDAPVPVPVVVLVGNEGEGLSEETIERCDVRVAIPMSGTASSLNVSVAAGIILYELRRRLSIGSA